jgi:long-chain acyl-CoA synthetase
MLSFNGYIFARYDRSAHSLSTAFGRAVAYSAIFGQSSFATLDSTKLFTLKEVSLSGPFLRFEYNLISFQIYPKLMSMIFCRLTKLRIPSPTILFIKPAHLNLSHLQSMNRPKVIPIFVRQPTQALGAMNGFIAKDSLWDRMLFDGARSAVLGEVGNTVRGVVSVVVSLTGTIIHFNLWLYPIRGLQVPSSLSYVTSARIALSVPFVNSHIHPFVAGPVFASQPARSTDFPRPT